MSEHREIPIFQANPEAVPEPKGPRAYLGNRWKAVRRRHLMGQPMCLRCGLFGEEVHHVKTRHEAPERRFDPSNLLTMCRACHAREHGKKLSTSYPHSRHDWGG